MKNYKIISILLTVILVLSGCLVNVHAETNTSNEKLSSSYIAGYTVGVSGTVERLAREARFSASRGHGFAAEDGNMFYDKLAGKKGKVLYENIKDGADRVIYNKDGSTTFIQDKYYKTATESIKACFEEGKFRYFDAEGKPMQIEVPKDQYEQAVEAMRTKIREGKIEGVTDPNEATNIVKKGRLTYKQAVNLTKSMNIDSLKYDAANGVITAACAFGISFVIDYALCIKDGKSPTVALKEATIDSLKTGGIVFGASVISAQLVKTEVAKRVFVPSIEKLVNVLGNDFAKALSKACGQNLTGEAARRYASRILSSNILFNLALVAILSAKDVKDMISGRISEKQFFINLSTTISTVVVGSVGWLGGARVGARVLGGIGGPLGGLVGALLGAGITGYVTPKVIGKFIEDDAEEMYGYIQEEFKVLSEEYLIDEKEGDNISEELVKKLNKDTLKDMYQSKNRKKFAKKLLEPIFVKVTAKRKNVKTPSMDEVRYKLKSSLQGVVFTH